MHAAWTGMGSELHWLVHCGSRCMETSGTEKSIILAYLESDSTVYPSCIAILCFVFVMKRRSGKLDSQFSTLAVLQPLIRSPLIRTYDVA